MGHQQEWTGSHVLRRLTVPGNRECSVENEGGNFHSIKLKKCNQVLPYPMMKKFPQSWKVCLTVLSLQLANNSFFYTASVAGALSSQILSSSPYSLSLKTHLWKSSHVKWTQWRKTNIRKMKYEANKQKHLEVYFGAVPQTGGTNNLLCQRLQRWQSYPIYRGWADPWSLSLVYHHPIVGKAYIFKLYIKYLSYIMSPQRSFCVLPHTVQ